jgi:hypothetical protein
VIASASDPSNGDGTAKSYLDVNTSVPGDWSSQLNTNFFTRDPCGNVVGFSYPPGGGCPGNPAAPGGVSFTHAPDIRLNNVFDHNGATAWNVPGTDIVGLRSNDPGRTSAVQQEIPEPDSLALIGLGIGALAFVLRRRRNG